MITVAAGNPKDPATAALLGESRAYLNGLYPPEACYALDLDALCADHIRFFVARESGVLMGTGALAIKTGYGEVKSMFTAPAGRGKGVAAAMLRMIEDTARTEGLPLLRLETGTGLDAAHRLYARFGFTPCDRFGDYADSPYSIYMEKPL